MSPILTSPDGETLIRLVFGTMIYLRPATMAIDCGGVTSMSNCERLEAKLAVGGTHDVIPPITLPPPPVESLALSFRLDDAVVTGVDDGRLVLKGLSGVEATVVCAEIVFVLDNDGMVADKVVFKIAAGAFTSLATVNSCWQL